MASSCPPHSPMTLGSSEPMCCCNEKSEVREMAPAWMRVGLAAEEAGSPKTSTLAADLRPTTGLLPQGNPTPSPTCDDRRPAVWGRQIKGREGSDWKGGAS